MKDLPDAATLSVALEAELRALAAQAPRELRLRLLVAAHAAGLMARDLASVELAAADVGPDLVAAIRKGDWDHDLAKLAVHLRQEVAARAAVALPGYTDVARAT